MRTSDKLSSERRTCEACGLGRVGGPGEGERYRDGARRVMV